VLVGDGRGRIAAGRVAEVGRGRLVVAVHDRRTDPPPAPRLVVAQALAKGGRDEDAVEAMTEVGVDAVLGWPAARSIARWTDRTAARWSATARSAAKQSRRPWIPEVTGPVPTPLLVARAAAAALAVVLHEQATRPLPSVPVPAAGEVLLVVGPEGGLTDEEVEALTAAGALACRIGRTVLRASTAGVAALSVLSAAARWR
jgi:16S rRNA (uracil1498-N3)-methyltransferase